ncbi:MAG: hypothetical protein WDO70_03125 [Alphaproteobacteria bacterium]
MTEAENKERTRRLIQHVSDVIVSRGPEHPVVVKTLQRLRDLEAHAPTNTLRQLPEEYAFVKFLMTNRQPGMPAAIRVAALQIIAATHTPR